MRSLIVTVIPALHYESLQKSFMGELVEEVTPEAAESFDFDSLNRHQFGPLQLPEFDQLTPFQDMMAYAADNILQEYQIAYLQELGRYENQEVTPLTRITRFHSYLSRRDRTRLRVGVREVIRVRMLLRLRNPGLARKPLSFIEASMKPDDDLFAIGFDEYQNLVAMSPERRGDHQLVQEIMDSTGVGWEIATLVVGNDRPDSMSATSPGFLDEHGQPLGEPDETVLSLPE